MKLPFCTKFDTKYSRFSRFEKDRENLVMRKRKARKIKWLGLDKLSKIAKIKCREISPFKNRGIKYI